MKKNAILALLLLWVSPLLFAQSSISFKPSNLQGANVGNPTSLQFGPDGRLYVSEVTGKIWALTVQQQGDGSFKVTNSETITHIMNIKNHDDIGTPNQSVNYRLVTGILVAGTANNPVLYVSSADGRRDGDDVDTNSGILTKLTKNGGSWDRVDLIRGLPRSKESHSVNGMDLDEANNKLYMMVGGNTDAGTPSGGKFFHTPEYYMSSSLLEIDLTKLESMTVWTDKRTNTKFVYDLPTIDDPERGNINNTHSEFPYPQGHPYYNKSIDINDPFGGHGGLNQAYSEPSSQNPIVIYSRGYRNAFDVVYGTNKKLYTIDNGANGGKMPNIYKSDGTYKSNNPTDFNQAAGDYVTGSIGGDMGASTQDQLHYIYKDFYAGHPNPVRAFPERAGIFTYDDNGNQKESYETGELFPSGLKGYPDEGKYLTTYPVNNPPDNSLISINSSSNGLDEYTANRFMGKMQGNLIAAIYRDKSTSSPSYNRGFILSVKLNSSGTDVVDQDTLAILEPSDVPLDVTCPEDGTIWIANFASGRIVVLSPDENVSCPTPGSVDYNPEADYDQDGYKNSLEVLNGTDICSASSKPADADNDKVPDAQDTDDDNDGLSDSTDPFVLDKQNGKTTNLPVYYGFDASANDPGFFTSGFTGLMSNGITDYSEQFGEFVFVKNNPGVFGVKQVNNGSAIGDLNSQEYAFQFGFNVTQQSEPFTITSKLSMSFTYPINKKYFNAGIYLGSGDQDNYLKVGYLYDNGETTAEVVLEVNGTTQINRYPIERLDEAIEVIFMLDVDPANATVQPYLSIDDGETIEQLGEPMSIPTSWLSASDNQGLAAGIISTASPEGDNIAAMWTHFNVVPNDIADISLSSQSLDFESSGLGSHTPMRIVELTNLGDKEGELPVRLKLVTLTGADADGFKILDGYKQNVIVGAPLTINVTMLTEKQGKKNATLRIEHNGGVEQVQLQGEVTEVVGLSPDKDRVLNLYPNPAAGNIVLENTSNIAGKASFFDLQGKLIYQFEVTPESKETINLKQRGAYLIKFIGTDGTVQLLKLVNLGE
ncbi:T9SS type A sorting domain-containing protein [Limibacter armeniacum]|uniref:T9SS type A sorting domain-containing protein n=1 Tax=Limibacter armeniacum TaxID=466084 RepID=UPI002FE57162